MPHQENCLIPPISPLTCSGVGGETSPTGGPAPDDGSGDGLRRASTVRGERYEPRERPRPHSGAAHRGRCGRRLYVGYEHCALTGVKVDRARSRPSPRLNYFRPVVGEPRAARLRGLPLGRACEPIRTIAFCHRAQAAPALHGNATIFRSGLKPNRGAPFQISRCRSAGRWRG